VPAASDDMATRYEVVMWGPKACVVMAYTFPPGAPRVEIQLTMKRRGHRRVADLAKCSMARELVAEPRGGSRATSGALASEAADGKGVVPGPRQTDDELLRDMNALWGQALVDPHGVERGFLAAPLAERLDHRPVLPFVEPHPGWTIADPEACADHLPGSFGIVEAMARTRKMTDGRAVGWITKAPAVVLPADGVAEPDQHVIAQLGWSPRLAMLAEIVGRRAGDPRKGAELAGRVARQASDITGADGQIYPAYRQAREVVGELELDGDGRIGAKKVRQSGHEAYLRECRGRADADAALGAAMADIGERTLGIFEIVQELPTYPNQALPFQA
jgi:hypothetical protein